MINRELIRLKTVQIVYAYYINEGKSIDTTQKELFQSLSKSYELYLQLLALILAIDAMARRITETQIARAHRLNDGTTVPVKFANNRFAAQLRANEQLAKASQRLRISWADEESDFLRKLCQTIAARDFFIEYQQSDTSSWEEDREVWRKIYRHVLCENDELDEILEGADIYWNDDKFVVDTFVLKTIRQFDKDKGGLQELLPEFSNEEDHECPASVLRAALSGAETSRRLVSEQTHNWQLDRIARMDLFIIQVAMAEITCFPEIPLNVSINEYVEIAKAYSTPRSAAYVNGMLDAICKRLAKEGTLADKIGDSKPADDEADDEAQP